MPKRVVEVGMLHGAGPQSKREKQPDTCLFRGDESREASARSAAVLLADREPIS